MKWRIPILFAIFAAGFATAAQAQQLAPQRITGIASVTLLSSDFQKSSLFYANILGMPKCNEAARLCFSVSEAQTVYIDSHCLSEGPCEANSLFDVAFATSDADSLRSYLQKRGVKVSELAGYQQSWKRFTAIDPDGHRIQFVQLAPGASKGSTPNHVSSQIIHAGFVVHDRAAEEHFYKDILGFRPYWHGGMKDDQTDWVSLQVPDGNDWVEFMVNVSPNADHHTLGVMNHIALGVTDIHAAQQQLIKNGWNPTEEPKIGRGGKWQLNVYDPDGTRIEFMEFKPVQKPCCSEYTGPHPGPKQ